MGKLYYFFLPVLVSCFVLIQGFGMGLDGTSKFPGPVQQQVLAGVRPPLFHNWSVTVELLADPRYVPTIWSGRYLPANLAELARSYPGRTWLVLNEPEFVNQANTDPSDAAALMEQVQASIGTSGFIACCGTSYLGGAYSWLDGYMDAGGPIPGLWHIHVYATTIDEWDRQLARFQDWAAGRGVNRPIIVSETSAGADSAAQSVIMGHTRQAVDTGRVQAAFWWSAMDEVNGSSALVTDGGAQLTTLGQQYVGAAMARSGEYGAGAMVAALVTAALGGLWYAITKKRKKG